MIHDIEEKIKHLNPESHSAVLAFVEFLLSRQEKCDGFSSRSSEEESEELIIPDMNSQSELSAGALNHSPVQNQKSTDSGIILAEERIIEENNTLIDFADINTRFLPKEKGQETNQVRQQKMLDWL